MTQLSPNFKAIAAISFLCVMGFLGRNLHAQNIIYNQEDLLHNYDSECYDDNLSFYPSINCLEKIEGTVNVLPVYFNAVHNTGYARGLNDGPAWQGKGANFTMGVGMSGNYGRLTYVINPMIQYAENLPFMTGADQGSRPEFQYPFSNGIDYVTRYGDDPFLKFFPGQSELSLDLNPVVLSLSTQNMRWGPAIYNPIIMSANAGGIPHLRAGTFKPVSTKLGLLEGNIVWGLLRESDYFNNDTSDDLRYFTGASLAYSPSFFKGFTISFQRVLYTQEKYLTGVLENGTAVFSGFLGSKGAVVDGREFPNDVYDQIASISMEYENKEENFKVYWEWARGDFADAIEHYLEVPEDNSGYTMGMWKKYTIDNKKSIRFIYEHTNLATWETRIHISLGSGSFYTHGINKQGYTNNGQVMGASIGPGSSADVINISYLWGKRILSLEYQRSRYNDDYFYTTFTSGESTPQDVEHQIGLKFESKYFSRVSYFAGVFTGIRDNYLFNDEIVKFNLQTNIAFRYNF